MQIIQNTPKSQHTSLHPSISQKLSSLPSGWIQQHRHRIENIKHKTFTTMTKENIKLNV